jgi:hypothetical protein
MMQGSGQHSAVSQRRLPPAKPSMFVHFERRWDLAALPFWLKADR